MAQLLVCAATGEVTTIQADDHEWGNGEVFPVFYIVQVAGEVEDWAWLTTPAVQADTAAPMLGAKTQMAVANDAPVDTPDEVYVAPRYYRLDVSQLQPVSSVADVAAITLPSDDPNASLPADYTGPSL